MAEAFAKGLLPYGYAAFSSGIEKHGLNPWMMKVMEEVGVDMSDHHSKTIDELPAGEWFMVVTVCSHAEENCPYIPAENHIHLPFDDPPGLSRGLCDEREILAIYRRVRDEIKAGVGRLFQDVLGAV